MSYKVEVAVPKEEQRTRMELILLALALLIKSGSFLMGIRYLRYCSGMGLKDAKDIIMGTRDKLAAMFQWEDPRLPTKEELHNPTVEQVIEVLQNHINDYLNKQFFGE